MKSTAFSFIFICSIFIMMTIACERTEACERTDLHKSSPNNDGLISLREIEDCSECPNDDDCCCSVETQNHNSTYTLRFCGTADGSASCSSSGPSPCSSISGGGQVITLSPTGFRKGFCLGLGNAFSITNASLMTANIYVSCQYDLTSPQIIAVSIGPLETVYYDSDSGCFLTECE